MDEEFFRAVVASIGEGVLVVDGAGAVVYANAAAETMLGRKASGTRLQDWASELALPDGTSCAYADLPPVRAARGELLPSADFVVSASGVRVSMTSRPFLDRNGTPLGSVSILRDVTSERLNEQELERAKTFIDSIVENIPDMIFVKDADELRFERFNRAGEELLGLPREQLLGKTDYDVFPPEQAESFQKRDRDTLRDGRLLDIPAEPIDTAHGRRWLHTKKIPIVDGRGVPKYLLGISSDITARREAEEAIHRTREELEHRVVERTQELRRTEEQLRHAQKLEAVGRLAGGVAHDFNNVLAVILGHVGLLEQRLADDDPVRSQLDPIREAAEHAATLTRQLLAFSRKQVMQPRIVNMNGIVERARGMLARLLGEDIELAMTLRPDLGNIHADPALIEQVIINLAVNARDAMPYGGILRIETENVDLLGTSSGADGSLSAGPYVLLRVTDTGVGMDAETRARIFEPFFTTKALGKGTGLGLSMAYGVVTQSGGTIQVDSESGRGATFRVYLPRSPGERSLTPSPTKALVVRGGGETILIAEDEAPLRQILRSILEQAGYKVLDAASGIEAVAVSTNHPGTIHLLLSDVVMPVMDGPELARHLLKSRPTLRVLFMSGYTNDRLQGHEPPPPGTEHLEKPFTPQALTARVKTLLGH